MARREAELFQPWIAPMSDEYSKGRRESLLVPGLAGVSKTALHPCALCPAKDRRETFHVTCWSIPEETPMELCLGFILRRV